MCTTSCCYTASANTGWTGKVIQLIRGCAAEWFSCLVGLDCIFHLFFCLVDDKKYLCLAGLQWQPLRILNSIMKLKKIVIFFSFSFGGYHMHFVVAKSRLHNSMECQVCWPTTTWPQNKLLLLLFIIRTMVFVIKFRKPSGFINCLCKGRSFYSVGFFTQKKTCT